MKNRLLKIIYLLSYHLGIFRLFFFIHRKNQVILTYHHVIPDALFDAELPHFGVSCSISAFKKQLAVIKSRFTITTQLSIPSSCVLTFDDGYRNNLEVVLPLFNASHIQGVFFIPACYFESEHLLWVDELLLWVSYAPNGQYIVLGKPFVLDSMRSRHVLWGEMYQRVLVDYGLCGVLREELDRQCAFLELKKIINPELFRLRFKGLDAASLREMKNNGQLIACHAFRHDILSKLTAEELLADFKACDAFRDKYNSNYYAYPFGGEAEISNEVLSACKKSGYSAAFVNYDADSNDHYAIGRVSLGNLTDPYFIEAKLCGFENFLKKTLMSE